MGAPELLRRGVTTTVMTVFLVIFLLEYLPKIYHSVCFLRSMQNVSGFVFGTIWWGIALNLMAYFVAAHVSVSSLNIITSSAFGLHTDH